MYRKEFIAMTALLVAGCGQGDAPIAEMADTGPDANPAEKAASEITADLMRGYVRELSDDKYEGRGPGPRGDVAARQYLAGE
ncbi:MAG: hypothetical protein R3348_09975, partial [Xanthomonadales bacterium]|nr:hypothetical protein [Xanthomonadales bacterium]